MFIRPNFKCAFSAALRCLLRFKLKASGVSVIIQAIIKIEKEEGVGQMNFPLLFFLVHMLGHLRADSGLAS